MSISTSGAHIAGENYTLACAVTKKVAGLSGNVSVQWVDPGGDVVTQNPGIVLHFQTSGLTTNLTLTFQPLGTTSGGVYSCQVTLPSPAVVGGVITTGASQPVNVESRWKTILQNLHGLKLNAHIDETDLVITCVHLYL